MALDPHSEKPDLTLPEDYKDDHPQEHPTDWGWHGEWGGSARGGGLVVAAILLLMLTATNYNASWSITLIVLAALIVLALLVDRYRRKNAWRR